MYVRMTPRALPRPLPRPLQVVDRPLLLHHRAVDLARHSRRPVLWARGLQETQTTLRKDPTVKLWRSEPACVSQPHCNIRKMGLHTLYPTFSNTYVLERELLGAEGVPMYVLFVHTCVYSVSS